jgi:uroporphyrin-III C-methyltransferase/precorrin-2 dehydrogenase/sirohydrochlorin ferrochelatase
MTRPVEPAPSDRIAPLAVLPVFFKLPGRAALIVGGTAGASWKAELLSAAGARLRIVAQEVSPEMEALVAAGHALERRDWAPSDLEGMALAVGDFAADGEAARFSAAARAVGVPVNCVDRPSLCDFQFGSIVNRSPLVVGISTDGAAPVFGQAIRARIETLLPAGFRHWAEAALRWRPSVQALSLPFQARRRLWERFAQAALARPNEMPTEADRDAFLASATAPGAAATEGSVVLVGAGPGDAELLTLKAVRALQSADVVLHDDLVAPAVLEFARREARRLVVGKRGHRPSCRQEDINRLMISLAQSGKRVVRLKGGDPMIFGRAGEEIAACRAAGVAVEVVPGITAALGAAASLAVSLTHRLHARRVQFVTAHSKEGRLPEDLDWQALADPAATTAVYMGKAVLPAFTERALAAGLAPTTPVVIVENATRADERVFHATVGSVVARLAGEELDGPCMLLIGAALGEAVGAGAAVADGEPEPARSSA